MHNLRCLKKNVSMSRRVSLPAAGLGLVAISWCRWFAVTCAEFVVSVFHT